MLDYEKGNFACINHAEISSYSQPVLSNVEFLLMETAGFFDGV